MSTVAVSRVSSTPTPPSIVALPSATLSKTPTATSTATVQSATLTSTFTPQPTATETPFAIPTPLGREATEQVLWLLETNNGCKLPCWWGITPGETSWDVAEQFFDAFASNIQAASSPQLINYSPLIPLSLEVFEATYTYPIYTVRNGIVEEILTEVSIGDTTPSGYLTPYLLSTFLTTYGKPSEVWLFTYPSPFEEGDLPFFVILIYPDQGIIALYDDNGEIQGNMVEG